MNAPVETYRGWQISPAFIGYHLQHPDFDPENETDWRYGHAETVEAARAEIDHLLAEDAEWDAAADIVRNALRAPTSTCRQCGRAISDEEYVVNWESCAECFDKHIAAYHDGPTSGYWRAEGPDMFGDYNILTDVDSLAIGCAVSNMRDPGQVRANAHMLAASKQMYAALVNARDQLWHLAKDKQNNPWVKQCDEALSTLRSAAGSESRSPCCNWPIDEKGCTRCGAPATERPAGGGTKRPGSALAAFQHEQEGIRPSTSDVAAERDAIIEACAILAEKHYAGHGSALGSLRARAYEHAGSRIAAAIRATKAEREER